MRVVVSPDPDGVIRLHCGGDYLELVVGPPSGSPSGPGGGEDFRDVGRNRLPAFANPAMGRALTAKFGAVAVAETLVGGTSVAGSINVMDYDLAPGGANQVLSQVAAATAAPDLMWLKMSALDVHTVAHVVNGLQANASQPGSVLLDLD